MNITMEEKKAKALECLNKLQIYKPYINGFKAKATKTCWFERFSGYWTYQDEELANKVKEFEKENNCLVYAITHEYLEFGECYSFLYISDYKEDWEHILEDVGKANCYYASAYVWNKSAEWCSEFGDIVVQAFGGGLRRVA